MGKPSDAVRLLVVEWKDDAPRGAVSRFCAEHGVSRAWFYSIRDKARVEGAASAMVKGSRRPLSSPNQTSELSRSLIIETAMWLRSQGLEAGPLSVIDQLQRSGLGPVPSRVTAARTLAQVGLVTPNSRKRPKSSYRRFQASFPNQHWQIDAFERRLSGGQRVVVYEIIDDCTRKHMAVLAARGETVEATLLALQRAITAYGRPVLVHSDNGAALNPTRRGMASTVVDFLHRQGIQAITGKPGKPTTQGKVERSHKGFQLWLDHHPAATLEQLQDACEAYVEFVDNRSHQALPPRTSPNELWDRLEKLAPSGLPIRPATTPLHAPNNDPGHPRKHYQRKVSVRGQVSLNKTMLLVDPAFQGHTVHLIEYANTLEIYTPTGALQHSIPWPATSKWINLHAAKRKPSNMS